MLITRSTMRTKRGEAYATGTALGNLRRVLLETAAWCRPRANPLQARACLRTETLRPYAFNNSRHETLYDVVGARHGRLEAAGTISTLRGREDELVDVTEIGIDDALRIFREGRLLVWHRDDTIDDGAGELETDGYLDESDMPPWDTWSAYVDSEACSGYLLSWVPPEFIERTGRAIECNAYGALYWLRGSDLRLASILKSDELLV